MLNSDAERKKSFEGENSIGNNIGPFFGNSAVLVFR
jgi:hypothetical protein